MKGIPGGIKFTYPVVTFDKSFYPNAKVVADDIEGLRRKIRSFREPLNESLRFVIIPSIKQNFLAEGRPKWAPLTAETVRRRGSAHPILHRKGNLKKRSTQINIWNVEKDRLYVSGLDRRVKYAKFHQGGTFQMPARPFMVYQNRDIVAIERIFRNWLNRKIREARFK